ncbi:hypothetical protein E3T33_03735 [Cryobacterium sp. TMT1-2-1]|uniref:hypothetical protein n=1 Tax=Cryobacterium sp. TMT1-2-1 TaxID=1259232 RepID=UPI00106D2B39|nr:hypothetical protein [Cryobacterium sp. TMT1-2-1]TFD47146.1 hypothetical protein E3T33_03735 [Cryobacterium sp. TMT1-2-1]
MAASLVRKKFPRSELKSGDESRASKMLQNEADFDVAGLSSDMSQLDMICKIGQATEDDAVSASFRVSCPTYQMDLTITIDENGKVTEFASEVLGSDDSGF